MSRELVESIIAGKMLEANDMVENTLAQIRERKMYEMKRMYATKLDEIVKPVKGKPGEFEGQNTKKDWAKYRKQTPSLGMRDTPEGKAPKDTHERNASGGLTKHGIEQRRKAGYVPAYAAQVSRDFVRKVIHYHKTGEVTEGNLNVAASEWEKFEKSRKADEKQTKTQQSAAPETPKPKVGDDSISSGMRQKLRGMYRQGTTKKQYDIKTGQATDVKGGKTGDIGRRLLRKNISAIISGKNAAGNATSRLKAVGRASKIVSTSPTVKKVDKALDSNAGKDFRDIGMRNL